MRIVTLFQRFLCGLGRHDYLRTVDRAGRVHRMYLVCAHCGHETPGWGCEAKRLVRVA